MRMYLQRYTSITAFFMLMLMFGTINGNYTVSSLERLIEDKRRAHNKLVMPVNVDYKPLTVNVGFIIRSLKYIDDVREFMSVVGSLEMHWHDDRIAWNKSDYDGIESVLVNSENFWKPFVFETNSIEDLEMVGKDTKWPLRIQASGDVSFFPMQVFTVSCPIDITLYPMDKQTCNLEFLAFGSLPSEIQFALVRDQVDTWFYVVNSAWELKSSFVKTTYNNGGIDFELTFARRPSVIVMNVISPIVLMSFLNCVAFIIPVESGEKISYSMTILLAITVFLTLVSEDMPKSAVSVAALSYYLLAVFSQACMMMIATVVNVKIFYTNDEPTPGPFWSYLVKCVCCQKKDCRVTIISPLELKRRTDETVINTINKSNKYGNGRIEATACIDEWVGNTTKEINTNGHQEKSGMKNIKDTKENHIESSTKTNSTWKDVSKAFDRIFFILSLLLSTSFAAFYFGYLEIKSS